jgi:hypothetical protein
MVDTWGVSNRDFPASGGFQIDVLKTHRVRCDDFYRWRGLLENPEFKRSADVMNKASAPSAAESNCCWLKGN